MRINPLYVSLFGVAIVCICLLAFQFSGGAVLDDFNSAIANKNARGAQDRLASDTMPLGIPRLVHHTWKRSVAPPAELIRWRNGCLKLNSEYEFRMYNDEDLLDFARLHFERYLPMFQHLHGVYMADMARVLVAYHHGGIYMDLDFYCHKPFRCLIKQVMQQIVPVGTVAKDVLVVAREPLAHAVLFRNKSRVVIQDFYMVTPKHPFLLWLLEDRYQLYQQSILSASSSPDSTQLSATSSHARVTFPKGPFSYSIEKDIDRYYAHKAAMRSSDSAHKTDTDVIIELGEDILHPLVDATNARLFSACARHSDIPVHTAPTKIAGSGPVGQLPRGFAANTNISTGDVLPVQINIGGSKPLTFAEMKRKVCRDVQKRRYFQPSRDTVMVHMWTHVYLGWSFVRGLYNAWTYFHVESTLPPASTC